MNDRKSSLNWRLIQSFGAMRNLILLLNDLEALRLQLICKWMYEIGVGRSQVRLIMKTHKFFSTFGSDKMIAFEYLGAPKIHLYSQKDNWGLWMRGFVTNRPQHSN